MAKQGKRGKVTPNKPKDKLAKKVVPPPVANHFQALQFIDKCVSMAPLSRNDHVQAQQALRQLSGALGELDRMKTDKKKE